MVLPVPEKALAIHHSLKVHVLRAFQADNNAESAAAAAMAMRAPPLQSKASAPATSAADGSVKNGGAPLVPSSPFESLAGGATPRGAPTGRRRARGRPGLAAHVCQPGEVQLQQVQPAAELVRRQAGRRARSSAVSVRAGVSWQGLLLPARRCSAKHSRHPGGVGAGLGHAPCCTCSTPLPEVSLMVFAVLTHSPAVLYSGCFRSRMV